jgi:amino acid transporter/nucleotide-binding universal stress UspA family protein
MGKKLERDLGLLEVCAISIGAMVGSGIFILPALALEMAGPAVILAYLLAGLLVVPAALSKSEMATAMPEAGGTYLYIERGMGPMLGTIAGIGTWFSLTFKSGLALVGGVPYVFPEIPVKPLAIGLAIALIALNIFGTKLTGQFQMWLVVIMLGAMVWFIVGSVPEVNPGNFEGFFEKGSLGILKATGFVFVSYAGVTKIASVAEEIEDPGTNIPWGMMGSLIFTTLLYLLLVIVMIGVVAPESLAGSVIPMSDAAEATLGNVGVYVVVGAAVLALVSTANAGIMSASRYPLAMARDYLFPESMSNISERFGTPIQAVSLTGAILLLLIAVFPIREIAKLASAFQILVFIIINLAVVAFREGKKEDYEPEFRSPLYPWMQIFGALGGLVLLPQMGWLPFVGAIVIIGGSIGWYFAYGRRRVDREGAATEGIRRAVSRKIVQETKDSLEDEREFRALIALREGTDISSELHLMRLGHALVAQNKGDLAVMQFDQVPDQVPLGFAVEQLSTADRTFERQSEKLEEQFGFEATYGEIAAHDIKSALINYARHKDIDALLLPAGRRTLRDLLPPNDLEWILRNAPCDVMLVDLGHLEVVNRVVVVTSQGAYEPSKIDVADAIAEQLGVELHLVHPLEETAATSKREAIEEYHDELAESCRSEAVSEIVDVEDQYADLVSTFSSTDLALIGLEPDGFKYRFFERPQQRLIDRLPCSSIQYRPRAPEELSALERFLERRVF